MKSTRGSPRTPVCSITLTALAAFGLGLAFSPARAANPDLAYTPVSQSVQYADLNLKSNDGISRLYQRIRAAATQVCGTDNGTRSLAEWSQARSCARVSASRAVAQINNAALTAFYTRRTGLIIDRRTLLAKR